jgi:polyisoprenoid-binding protein YceI
MLLTEVLNFNIFMRLKMIALVFVLGAFTSFSQELVQDKTASEITFTIKNFGFNVPGNFNQFIVSSNFSARNLKGSFLNAKISVASIFTDSEARDEHLLEVDYFNIKKYPNILFESTVIEKITPSKYLLKGFITIKGIKKRVATTLNVTTSQTTVTFLTDFSLNRIDFGVGGSSFVLSKEVNIKMKYVATKN